MDVVNLVAKAVAVGLICWMFGHAIEHAAYRFQGWIGRRHRRNLARRLIGRRV